MSNERIIFRIRNRNGRTIGLTEKRTLSRGNPMRQNGHVQIIQYTQRFNHIYIITINTKTHTQ